MNSARTAVVTLALAFVAVFTSAPAFADATAFLGSNLTPSNRVVAGAALGGGFAFFAFEVEYASTSEDLQAKAPALKTGMANALLQAPLPLLGLQPYVTAGGGIYQETLDTVPQHNQTGFGWNVGGCVKISLIGQLGLRLDYRAFSLGNGALGSPAHRIYAGLNLKF